MEKLPELGLARNIGVCNFSGWFPRSPTIKLTFVGSLLMDLMTYANIKPAVLQVEMNPYNAQTPLIKMAEAFGIRMMAFSSFGPQSSVPFLR